MPPANITAVATLDNQEKYAEALQLAREKCSLDRIEVDIAWACPGGVDTEYVTKHKLVDYFDKIDIITENANELKIVFHIKSDATSYWKDIIVNTLVDLEKLSSSFKIVTGVG